MSSSSPTLSSWLDTITNSLGQALPDVTIIVLRGTVGGNQEADTDVQPGTPLAAIYSDPYGDSPIDQINAPLNTSAGDGTFQFWAAPGYYVIQAYGPGIIGQLVYGIQLGGSGSGSSGPNWQAPISLAGTVDGVNKSFSFASLPSSNFIITVGGSILTPEVDYTVSGTTVVFTAAPIVAPVAYD